MSGSVFGNRIKTTDVKQTVDSYKVKVLNKFKSDKYHFVKCVPTGSYNRYIKENKVKQGGHGDIDLIVYISINKGYENQVTIKDIKKDFKNFLDALPNDITVPFRNGNNKGKKSQLFGSIVTCTFPILDDIEEQSSNNPVQIDNMIVLSEKDYIFQSNFFNMSVQMQATLQGVFRCIMWETYYKYKENNLDQIEFNLSYNKLTLRGISYIDNIDWKEDKEKRIILSESNDWNDVIGTLEEHFPLFIDYINRDDVIGLINTIKLYYDERSLKRIFGVIKSMIRVGENEKNTQKGNEKEQFIEFVKNTFKI